MDSIWKHPTLEAEKLQARNVCICWGTVMVYQPVVFLEEHPHANIVKMKVHSYIQLWQDFSLVDSEEDGEGMLTMHETERQNHPLLHDHLLQDRLIAEGFRLQLGRMNC